MPLLLCVGKLGNVGGRSCICLVELFFKTHTLYQDHYFRNISPKDLSIMKVGECIGKLG